LLFSHRTRAQALQARARRRVDGRAGARRQDALVLVDELLVVGMAIDDVDLDALALIRIDGVGIGDQLHERIRDVVDGACLRIRLLRQLGQPLIGAMHHAYDHERRLRLAERFEHLVREREELSGADAARALQ
jgi:hypothetical protein